MLNGLAEFNCVGLAQFYYKSCLNAIQISYRFKYDNYDSLYFVLVNLGHRPVC